MISILIIDDHPLVIDGIRTMLKDIDYLQISGACKTGKLALEFLSEHTPDIILLDISLPDIDGLQLCEMIRKNNKESRIIGLTSANEAGVITSFLQRGGNGYLLKDMEREELLLAIDKVLSGSVYLSSAANAKVLEQFQSIRSAVNNVPVVTRREKEILQLFANGMKGPQIADQLFLSHYTVETHRKNLLKKFNANSIQLVIKIARDYRIIG
jgi:DNA-binding NarL/FixJ family response regulator